jgi:murein DD-endopeptidase MepM/ murein hydrolase activator NlpD
MKHLFRIYGFTVFVLLISNTLPVKAQTPDATPSPDKSFTFTIPIHVVSEGETLTLIATLYDVTVADLLLANNLNNGDILYVGQQLSIPANEGESVVTTYTIQVGDSLVGIAAAFNTTVEQILRTNHTINRHQLLIVGQPLSVFSRTGSADPQMVTGRPHVVSSGETLLLIAARYGLSPLSLAVINDLQLPAYLFRGQRLRIPAEGAYRYLPGEWVDIRLRPLPLMQGSTASIYVENLLEGRPAGMFAGQTLLFAPEGNGYVTIVGLDAFTKPGLYPLELAGPGDQPGLPFRQDILVQSSNLDTQSISVGEALEMLLDPQVRAEEDVFFASVYGNFTETRQWEGLFQTPLTTSFTTAPYGVGRSYNGGPVETFHTGIDFAAPEGTLVMAPANGMVVFNGFLDLRGNSVILDHGVGVMTGYYHLSDSFVVKGNVVSAGQPIAIVGSTGLSTGPHLHWDMRVMNVAVNGLQWTEDYFP